MKKLLTLAALAATLSIPAQADDVLEAYSYACKYERHLDELGAARWASDDKARDLLIAKRECFLVNSEAPVRIVFEEDGKAHFRVVETGARLWTWSRNIGRGR